MESNKKSRFPILPNNLETFALQTIAISFLLKIVYAYSRPIFNSGPDANGYIPMALDIAHRGLFSSDISGLPLYPIGYGVFLSVFVQISEIGWIQLTQFVQITLISMASYLFFLLVKSYFNGVAAYLSLWIFLFAPAIFTMTTQAMYEPLLISMIICIYYITFCLLPKNNFNGLLRYLSVGIMSGLALVTHPRSIFILLLPFAFIAQNLMTMKTFLALFSGVFSIIATVLIRNFEALGFLTLSTATKYSVAYGHKSIGLCESSSCYLNKVLGDPSTFILESFRNFLYFFSPYSGPLTRGTWFHNLSVSSFLDKNGFQSLALIFSGIVALTLFTLFIIGCWQYYYINKLILSLFICIIILTALTDAFVYGDSRHRLLVMPFMVPLQVYGFLSLLRKLSLDRLRNFLKMN